MKKSTPKKPKRTRPCKVTTTRSCGVRVLLDEGRIELIFRSQPQPDLGEKERLENLLD